jgi:hypothetical protein
VRLPDDEINLNTLSVFLEGKGLALKRISSGRADKKEWLLSFAEPGKYLISGNKKNKRNNTECTY